MVEIQLKMTQRLLWVFSFLLFVFFSDGVDKKKTMIVGNKPFNECDNSGLCVEYVISIIYYLGRIKIGLIYSNYHNKSVPILPLKGARYLFFFSCQSYMTYSYRNDDLYYHAISYHVLRISRKQKENRKKS